MEKKGIVLELKDFSKERRTAVIAHAVYNNIDRVGDISTKGMFNRSWDHYRDIDFLFNHDRKAIVGNVLRTFEDDRAAYTEVKFGNWTLGSDVLEMADSGVLRGASFGYVTKDKEEVKVNGKSVRKLKEVQHIETSLLTEYPANPLAGVVSLTKDAEIQLLNEFKQHIQIMEKFCRNTKASDESIKTILGQIEEAKEMLSRYDTADTQPITDESASVKEFSNALHLLTLKI